MDKKTFLTRFFQELNKNEVDYFVYGSYLALPDDTGGSDIDMIVAEKDFLLFKSILEDLIQKACACKASYYANANAKFYRLLHHDWGVQIDVFYKGLCFQGIEYYPMHLMKDRVIDYRGIKVLDIKKGYYVDYLKEILHVGKAKEKYIKAFIEEVNSDREYYRTELTTLYGKSVANLVLDNLSEELLPQVGKRLQKQMKDAVLKGHRIENMWLKLLLLSRLFGKRPGYVIVVEGTDGSGKSFIINKITPILNEAFHNSVIYNHLRPNAIPDLGVVFGKKKKDDTVHVCTDPHGQKSSGLIGSLIRWGYYMVDYTFGYLKKVWPQIHTKSKVFIFDRYYYEFYLDQKRSRTNLPLWIIRVGECLILEPDLILCLGGDPEKIYARKPETSLEEVRRQTKALNTFCEKRNNAVWIDTTVQPERSVSAAMSACYEMMNKRFK